MKWRLLAQLRGGALQLLFIAGVAQYYAAWPCLLWAEDQSITFSDKGKAVKRLTVVELKQLVPPRTVRVFEPHEALEADFRVMPLREVLSQVYGSRWLSAEQIFFICDDGYRAPVPVEDLDKNPAWLAFARVGSEAFAITEKEPVVRTIDVGPLFLVRGDERHLSARSAVKEGWPYKVVGIDLNSFSSQYPSLSPPASASAAVMRGYSSFSRHCATCHALGGVGGRVGPELGVPVSVTEYYKERWLKQWITNPSSVRAGTTMPAVIPQGPGQVSTVNDIVAYLKAMAVKQAAKP